MDTVLQTTLASVIEQLASFFGMTTETVMQNAPMWLAKYGWFAMMQNFSFAIFIWILLIGSLIALIVVVGAECDWKTTSKIKLCVIGSIILTILIFACWFFQCAIAPEFYGLQALLNAMK